MLKDEIAMRLKDDNGLSVRTDRLACIQGSGNA